jgi:ATPase subunit of ABC transporter with duplicated ATPase domains
MSMFDAIMEQRPLWNRGQVQNHLGAFGFSGEEVFREVATRVWSFDGARLTDFDGPFIEWEEERERRAAR